MSLSSYHIAIILFLLVVIFIWNRNTSSSSKRINKKVKISDDLEIINPDEENDNTESEDESDDLTNQIYEFMIKQSQYIQSIQ